jgi:RNase P protein component
MLAKNKRLNLRLIDLKYFFSHTNRINNAYFQAYFRLIDQVAIDDLVLEVSVVVSKKVSLLAVKRIQLKRIVYNFFSQELYKSLELIVPANKKLQLAIFIKKKALNTNKEQLIKELKTIENQIRYQIL